MKYIKPFLPLVVIVTLLGTLGWSILSEDPRPFVIGYPVSAALAFFGYGLEKRS